MKLNNTDNKIGLDGVWGILPTKQKRLSKKDEAYILCRLAGMQPIVTNCALLVPGASKILLDAFQNSDIDNIGYSVGPDSVIDLVNSVNGLDIDPNNASDCFVLTTCLNNYHLSHALRRQLILHCTKLSDNDLNNYTVSRPLLAFDAAFRKYNKIRDFLFSRNLGLVHHLCGKFSGNIRNLEYDDLFQEGCDGLLAAIERFKFGSNNRFFTYAHYWVSAYIDLALKNKERVVRIPAHAVTEINAINKGRSKLSGQDGNQDKDLLSKKIGVSRERIEFLDQKIAPPVSLNAEVGDNGISIQSRLHDTSPRPDQLLLNSIDGEGISHLMSKCLDERTENVIKLRFGLSGGNTMPFKQVAYTLGMKESTVHNIYRHGVKILRNQTRMRVFFDDLRAIS